MNPTTEEKVFKTTTAIKKNLELVAKASAYLNFVKNASTGEHLDLDLGDQLRTTLDYNGAIFEVVRKPYWAVVFQNDGTLADYAYKSNSVIFSQAEHDDAQALFEEKMAEQRATIQSETGISDVSLHTYPGPARSGEESDDENDERHYEVRWQVRSIPEGCRRETRVWVRKICLISKAEGLTDDKNFRSLVLTQKTIPFTELIAQQVTLLQKVSRSLEHTRPTDEKSRKMAGWAVNQKRCDELKSLWFNPFLLKGKTITAYSNTKYGLFLRNPVTYTITASGKNVVTQATDKMMDAKKEIAETYDAKEAVVKQLKKVQKDEGCLISEEYA